MDFGGWRCGAGECSLRQARLRAGPHVVGGNSAAAFPAAPKIPLRHRSCLLPPTGTAPLGSRRGPVSLPWRRKEKAPCVVKGKRECRTKIYPFGQISPKVRGLFWDGAWKLDGLNPSASDSVPPGGALPHLLVPSRLFCCFDARPLAPLPALRA